MELESGTGHLSYRLRGQRDINRFKSAKQVQKYAGLALKENSSGKHKGLTKISKRGRKKLRTILFRAVIPLCWKKRGI